MSSFNTPWFNNQNSNFFNTLNKSKVPHVVLTAETDDFDESIVQQWSESGFDVRYVPMGNGGKAFINRVHAVGDNFGISEQYAIVAFGSAASHILETHTKPTNPRLVAIVGYYPTALPSVHTKYPASIRVLVHLAGAEINVHQTAEVLGIQGKRKAVRKRVDAGEGRGELLRLPGNFRAYTYSSAAPGFAERDLDEWDARAAGVAFARSLGVVRRGFRLEAETEVGLESLRERWTTGLTGVRAAEGSGLAKTMGLAWPDAHVMFAPTLTGGVGEDELREFYKDFYAWPENADVRLLSRTIGTDRVVDELFVSLEHTADIPWLLPGVPPTGKKIEITMVVLMHARGAKLESEHVYWDQASVLVQAGLLDPKLVPNRLKKQGVKDLPIVGVESARAIKRGSSRQINALIPEW